MSNRDINVEYDTLIDSFILEVGESGMFELLNGYRSPVWRLEFVSQLNFAHP